MQNGLERWDGRVILLHWLTAASVILAFGAVWTRGEVDDRALRATLLAIHRSAGLLALGLTLVRMVVRSRVSGPEHPLPRLQALAARLMHIALYALLAAQPMLGWAYSSARGQPILLLGALPVPALPWLGRERLGLAPRIGETTRALLGECAQKLERVRRVRVRGDRRDRLRGRRRGLDGS